MSKEDWIILRLLKMALFHSGMTLNKFGVQPDVVKSILYLRKKYGSEKFYAAIDELNNKEYK